MRYVLSIASHWSTITCIAIINYHNQTDHTFIKRIVIARPMLCYMLLNVAEYGKFKYIAVQNRRYHADKINKNISVSKYAFCEVVFFILVPY